MTGAVTQSMRHRRGHPCAICGGVESDPRGKGKRCEGFSSTDGAWVHCARPEFAGGIQQNDAGLFAHMMKGACRCGSEHGAAVDAPNVEAVYSYVNEHGTELFQVLRKIGKKFVQRHDDGHGRWVYDMAGVRRVPFRLDRLVAADKTRAVYIVEGEKDVHTAERWGLIATCNPMGALKWHFIADEARNVLAGRDIVIVPDGDEVGRKHGEKVLDALRHVARSIRVVALPKNVGELGKGFDLSDFAMAGGTRAELEAIVAGERDQATPVGPAPDEHDAAEPDLDLDGEAANETGAEGAEVPVLTTFDTWKPEDIWKPLEPPDYVVDGLISRGNLVLIVAYGSSLKTWTLVDLAVASSTGGSWLHRFACKQVSAAIVDFESGSWELRRRLHLDAAGRNLETPIEGLTFVSMPPWSLADGRFFVAVEELTKTYGLILIDSLAAGSGGVDENDARFAVPLNLLKALAERTRTTIALLHHSKKTQNEDSKDERQMVRGSSAIFNAADVILSMSRAGEDAFTVRQIKARGGKAVDAFTVRVEDRGPEAVVVTAADAVVEAEEGGAVSESLQRAMAKLVHLLAHEKDLKTREAMFRRVKGRKSTFVDAVEELLENGTIVEHAGSWRLSSEVK